MIKELVGMTWGELKKETQDWFLERCNCVDAITCDNTDKGECVIDLDFNLSVAGKVLNDEIVVDKDSKIYNPSDEVIDIEIDESLDNVFTVTEAADKWGITEGAIRLAIKSRRLIPGIDYRKAGRITLITKHAMERLYLEMPKKVMRAIKKYDDEHLKKGDVITFKKVIEKTENIFGEEMWVVELMNCDTCNLIPEEFEIIE